MKNVTPGNYDSQRFVEEVILPMAKEIATICAENGIPAVICFQYSMEIDEDGDCAAGLASLLVPVAVAEDGEERVVSPSLMAAMRILAPNFEGGASDPEQQRAFSTLPICLN